MISFTKALLWLSAYCQYGISFGLNSQPLNVRHFIAPSACTWSYFVVASGLRNRSDKL